MTEAEDRAAKRWKSISAPPPHYFTRDGSIVCFARFAQRSSLAKNRENGNDVLNTTIPRL